MDKGGTNPQVLRRPGGGGAVSGIGSDLKTNLNTGVGTYAIPLELPDGHRGRNPQLSFQYSSGAGHGDFGLGWGLPVLALRRDTRHGIPRYDENDAFLLNGEELLPLGDGRFRPQVDATFQRVRRLEAGWEVTDRQGTRFRLGTSAASQERHPARPGEDGVLTWLLNRVEDTTGNALVYTYIADAGRLYLQGIDYAVYRLEVTYEQRPDVLAVRRGGFLQETRWRGTRIALHHAGLDPSLLRTYDLQYVQDPGAGHSLLATVTLTGHLPDAGGGETEQAPPLRFGYTPFEPRDRRLHAFQSESSGPPSLLAEAVDLVDLEGFGLPGVLQASHHTHRYWPNRGRAMWGVPRRLRSFPLGVSLADEHVTFGDLDGDGRADLLVSSGALAGYYPGEPGLEWGSLQLYGRNRPAFEARDPRVRWLDADGDGRVDALRTGGDGFQLYEGRGAEGWGEVPRAISRRRDDPTFPDVSFADPRVRLADMTGDGLLDMVRIHARHVEVWPGLGPGRWDERQVLSLGDGGPDRFEPARAVLADVNGDGLTDLLYVDTEAVYLWVNRFGRAFSPPVKLRYPPPAAPASVRAADLLGTGTAGLLFGLSYRPGVREPYRFVDFTGGAKPYLLTSVENGVGGRTEIGYGSSTAHRLRDRDAGEDWSTFLPRAIQVVDRVRNLDLVTGEESTVTYAYHAGHYDARAQRFVGFGRVDGREEYGHGQPAALVRSFFHLGLPDDAPHLAPSLAPALRGLLYRQEILDVEGTGGAANPDKVEWTEWSAREVATASDGRKILFPHPVRRAVERVEQTAAPSVLLTTLDHDDFGNVLHERVLGQGSGDAVPVEVEETIAEYVQEPERWILGLVARRTRRAAGRRLEDERFYYDNQPAGRCTAGLLTRHERLALTADLLAAVFPGLDAAALAGLGYRQELGAGGEAEYWLDEVRLLYDARGEAIEQRDALGRSTTIEYDADAGLHPVRVTNAAGHVHQATYHPRLGALESLTDPSRQVTSWSYTPLGRVRREVRPGDTAGLPTVEYEYRTAAPPIATVMRRRRRSGAAEVRESVSFYDGHGNTVQTRARLDDGRFQVTGWEVRDLRGLVIERHPPFVSPSEAFDAAEGRDPDLAHRSVYDPLRRLLSIVDPAGQRSHAIYDPDGMTFFDTGDDDPGFLFAGTPRVQRIDPAGRLVAVTEQTGGAALTTAYDYDGAGRLLRVTDAAGSVLLTQTFDPAGRKIQVAHRDAGTRRFLYDARGRLALYLDARGREVRYTSDAIGRPLTVAYGADVVERFTYDTGTGANLQGRLAEAEDRLGLQRFSYDARGRVETTERFIEGVAAPFRYESSYDPDDRLLRLTTPDGAVTERSYDAMGRLATVSGLIAGIDYDERGRRSRATYASGLVGTWTYDPRLDRLDEQALVDPATGEELLRERYSYDAAGNVLAVDDGRAPAPGVVLASRRFEYDALDRLTRAGGGPADAPYDHAFAYDAAGNLTSNPGFRPEPLWHDGARLRGVETQAGREALFDYDANGCLRSRPGMTLELDPRDLLTGVVRDDGTTVEIGYDHAARRLRKRVITAGGAVADTLYLGEAFEVRPDGTRLRYVRDPEGSATLVVGPAGAVHMLHHDSLGNTVVVRDATGAARQVHYLPFGRPLQADPALGEILFAGRRLDPETGLYYLRMRYYDPDLGRFISPDPIAVTRAEQGRLRPLALNPYVYALDNPLRYNDVNGLWSFWEGFLTVVLVVAVVAVTAATFGVGGVVALAAGAAVGALIGGLTTGSVDGALAGAMLGFSVVATALFAGALFGPLIGGALAGIQALGFIPGIRQNETYKDVLGYSSWLNPWAWPGHAVGAFIFIVNAVAYGIAYAVTGGKPGEKWEMKVSFENGMIVTEGGWIRPDRARNFGAFTTVNPNDPAVADPTSRDLILRHERGHMLNNAYFGVLQVGRLGSGDQTGSFWEQLAESNVNPNLTLAQTDKDVRRRAGGRGFGDIPWWNS